MLGRRRRWRSEPDLHLGHDERPPAAVTFSANGSNEGQEHHRDLQPGRQLLAPANYVKDQPGLTATSAVAVTVNQTLTSIVVSARQLDHCATGDSAVRRDGPRSVCHRFGHPADLHLERERRRDNRWKRPVHRRGIRGRSLHGDRPKRQRQRHRDGLGDRRQHRPDRRHRGGRRPQSRSRAPRQPCRCSAPTTAVRRT